MKRLIALMIIFSVISCLTKKENNYQKSDRVVIAGKVLNFNSQSLSVRILVNRIGVASVPLEADLDKEGNFLTTFKTYTPTDVWIRYKSNFLVLIHPGDSLYVEFDGNPKTRADVFKMIKFGGREAKLNRDAAEFQNRYYAREFSDQEKKTKAIKDYNVAEFKSYLDNNKTSLDSVFNQFVLDVKLEKTVKLTT